MSAVRVFNGFVPDAFPAKHQSPTQMDEWRETLRGATPSIVEFTTPFDRCWARAMVETVETFAKDNVWSADYPNSPTDRYPNANAALRSQIVLCQRFHWLIEAAAQFPDVETWVWIEPTIFKQKGITTEIIEQFLRDVSEHPVDAISLPGVWGKQPIVDYINHWRFCGSAWVCPRRWAPVTSFAMKELISFRTQLTRRLCWDNSSWSYLELLNVLPMRWYPGNHDETQFTGYLTGLPR